MCIAIYIQEILLLLSLLLWFVCKGTKNVPRNIFALEKKPATPTTRHISTTIIEITSVCTWRETWSISLLFAQKMQKILLYWSLKSSKWYRLESNFTFSPSKSCKKGKVEIRCVLSEVTNAHSKYGVRTSRKDARATLLIWYYNSEGSLNLQPLSL